MHCRVAHDKSDSSDNACSITHRYIYVKYVEVAMYIIAIIDPSGYLATDWSPLLEPLLAFLCLTIAEEVYCTSLLVVVPAVFKLAQWPMHLLY
jgi:hypothetical protein